MTTQPALAPATKSKAIDFIIFLSDRYCRENLYLPHLEKQALEKDWWGGLQLFLNHSFYQGRRDEVSEKVEAAAMPVLRRHFEHLDAKELGSTNFGQLDADLRAVIGKGKVGKARDVEMLVSIFQFVSQLSEKNLTRYSLSKIREGKLAEHYRELQKIRQVGPKIASFYLRDLVCIYDLDAVVKPEDLKFLSRSRCGFGRSRTGWESPIRKTAPTTRCAQASLIPVLHVACPHLSSTRGAWYLGKNAFDILIEQFEKIIERS